MTKYAHDLHDWTVNVMVMFDDTHEAICNDCNMYLYADSILIFAPKGLDLEVLLNPYIGNSVTDAEALAQYKELLLGFDIYQVQMRDFIEKHGRGLNSLTWTWATWERLWGKLPKQYQSFLWRCYSEIFLIMRSKIIDFVSPMQDNAFSPENVKREVYSKIDFFLSEEMWEVIDNAFAYCWNAELGLGAVVTFDFVYNSVYNQLVEQGYLIPYTHLYTIIEIILDYISKVPGAMLDD